MVRRVQPRNQHGHHLLEQAPDRAGLLYLRGLFLSRGGAYDARALWWCWRLPQDDERVFVRSFPQLEQQSLPTPKRQH
jgi:hypothetical protein